MTSLRERGSSPLGPILGLLFGGGAVMVIVALFMTGVAQREIVPRIRARAEQAMERATKAVKPGDKGLPPGAAGDSGLPGAAGASATAGAVTGPAGAAGSAVAERDSLASLAAQMETQKAFLAQREAELTRLRAGIDSLRTETKGASETEQKRQAKLLAAMKAEDAARVLGEMDDRTVAILLDAMNAKAAAKVMAKMDAARMARLTSAAVHKGDLTGIVPPPGPEATSAR